jgi:hypothetical protein
MVMQPPKKCAIRSQRYSCFYILRARPARLRVAANKVQVWEVDSVEPLAGKGKVNEIGAFAVLYKMVSDMN